MKEIILTILTVLSLLSGCKRVEEPSNLRLDYYPLELGKYRMYAVDSIIHDDLSQTTDTLHYFVREDLVDTIRDPDGEMSYRIEETYTFDTSQGIWLFKEFFTAKLNSIRAESNRHNRPLVKLIFPYKERVRWNRNELNSEESEESVYLKLHEAQTIGGISYDETISVELDDEDDITIKLYGKEIYAAGVGLVYLNSVNIDRNRNNGFELTKTLIETNFN